MGNALLVAWRGGTPERGTWQPVGRLDHDGGVYGFVYTRGATMLDGFRPFTQMENLEEVYESEKIFPVFANRLLPKSRPEYEAFLRWGGFSSDNPPDPISLLGVTEGRRQTDSIEVFPCPVPDSNACYLNKFFAHGLRWMPASSHERIARLTEGEKLYPMPDIGNENDPEAVALRTGDPDRVLVGYVPRYLARDVRKLIGECKPEFISVFAERLNRDAPLQQRLLCRMKTCWPPGFLPCNDEAFRPIPMQVPAGCPA